MLEKALQNTGSKNYKIGNSQSASLLAHITINCFAVHQKKLTLLLIDQAKNCLIWLYVLHPLACQFYPGLAFFLYTATIFMACLFVCKT